jgi:hypothetical protein
MVTWFIISCYLFANFALIACGERDSSYTAKKVASLFAAAASAACLVLAIKLWG